MFSPICFTNFFHLERLKKVTNFFFVQNKFFSLSLPVEKEFITNIRWKNAKIWNLRFVKTSDEFVIHWNEIEMGRVPNCESVLVHKTNQIMTKMRSFSKPLTDLPIRKWVVVFLTCSCLNILTNSIIIIKNGKCHSPRAMYYKKIMNNYWNKDTNKQVHFTFVLWIFNLCWERRFLFSWDFFP